MKNKHSRRCRPMFIQLSKPAERRD